MIREMSRYVSNESPSISARSIASRCSWPHIVQVTWHQTPPSTQRVHIFSATSNVVVNGAPHSVQVDGVQTGQRCQRPADAFSCERVTRHERRHLRHSQTIVESVMGTDPRDA